MWNVHLRRPERQMQAPPTEEGRPRFRTGRVQSFHVNTKDSTSMQRSCASHTMSVLSKCGSSNDTCCGSATSTTCCNIHAPPFWKIASVAANPVATGTEAAPVQEMSPLTRACTSQFAPTHYALPQLKPATHRPAARKQLPQLDA
mgnify:CR=1 FL=1